MLLSLADDLLCVVGRCSNLLALGLPSRHSLLGTADFLGAATLLRAAALLCGLRLRCRLLGAGLWLCGGLES